MVNRIALVAISVSIVGGVAAGCSSDNGSAASSSSPASLVSSSSSLATPAPTFPAAPSASAPVSAPPGVTISQAGTPEEAFWQSLQASKVPFNNVEGVIGTTGRMCDAIGSGKPVDAAVTESLQEQPWNPDQAKTALQVASLTLCPQIKGKI